MSLKSTLKATTLGVASLFMASKADAQTQQADNLKLDRNSMHLSSFIDPVIIQSPYNNQGEQSVHIHIRDGNRKGNPTAVVIIVKDENGDLIVQPEEVKDASMQKTATFWQNGQMEIIQSYDSGAATNEHGKRQTPKIVTQYLRTNGEAAKKQEIEMTTKDVIISNVLNELSRN